MHLGLRDPNSFPPTALSLGLGPQTLAGPLYSASGWGKREWRRYSGFFKKNFFFLLKQFQTYRRVARFPTHPSPRYPLPPVPNAPVISVTKRLHLGSWIVLTCHGSLPTLTWSSSQVFPWVWCPWPSWSYFVERVLVWVCPYFHMVKFRMYIFGISH